MTGPDTWNGASRLGLGTVQFGLDYGVTNSAGQVSEEEVARILRKAAAAGIDMLDTAALYGDSETVIGRLSGLHAFRVVSKTLKFDDVSDPNMVINKFWSGLRDSLTRLERPRLDALLVHQTSDLLGPNGDTLWRAIEEAKAGGFVVSIGASVYDGKEIDALLARYPIDIIQLPLNVVDHRLIEGGQIARLADRGIEIHARSALLQGLLTVAPEKLDSRFAALRPCLQAIRARSAEQGVSLLTLLLGAILRHRAISRLIVGATTVSELSELIEAAQATLAVASKIDYTEFHLADTRILNPGQWPTLA